MASRLAAIVLAALSIGVSACPASAQERPQAAERAGGAPEPKSFAAVTGRLTAQKGLLPTWFDKTAGRVLMQLPPPDAEGISGRFIYQASLSGGFGSTPLG